MEFALHILGQINLQIPTTALKLYLILFPCENIHIIYNNQKFIMNQINISTTELRVQ